MRIKHYAHIDINGKLVLSNPQIFKNELLRMKDRKVFVVVDEEKPTRSNEQNRYYWGVVLKLLSEYTGYTEDEIHEVLLDKFSIKKEVKIKDETHLIKSRSHKMKTTEFEDYLTKIRMFAQIEFEILIPLPNETIENI